MVADICDGKNRGITATRNLLGVAVENIATGLANIFATAARTYHLSDGPVLLDTYHTVRIPLPDVIKAVG